MEPILTTLKAIQAMVVKLMACLSLIYPWLAPFAALAALITAMDANYTTLINSINGLAAHMAAMPASVWLGQANRIVPITELMGMIIAELTLRGGAMSFRFIKSWIPTVN